MYVVLLSGGNNPGGETQRALEAVLAGVRAAGGDGEAIRLSDLDIRLCRHCEDHGGGLCAAEGRCALEDDFARVLARVRQADAIVAGSPVHLIGCAGSLRAFLRRVGRIGSHQAGRRGVVGKPAVGVCVGGGAARCAERLMAVLDGCGFTPFDVVAVARGSLVLHRKQLTAVGRRLAREVAVRQARATAAAPDQAAASGWA